MSVATIPELSRAILAAIPDLIVVLSNEGVFLD